MQVKDLNIEKEILPFFDFTWNEDARIKVKKFILTPLNTKDAIITRQKIVKGFLTNISLYTSYSYSRIDYREVSQFMSGYTDKEYLPKRLSTLLLLNKKRYYLYRSRCVQVILLYHRLHNPIHQKPYYCCIP
ncbi:hypothetical protein CHU92_13945 [Flavobacterium cyanobacteriorum]|uniref:Uncharacterized protein n=1 Tax=Flavobacterium cyanobacteriorum TaxID=2022802 RepID=A0A255YUY1_9FLAO|nr:hypothetical protein [Flavobacterium cyanobacteriorum]OYQ33018.1 hypothetical protein CHU92_13945 [Flavobacterium cyanobacteriorum]